MECGRDVPPALLDRLIDVRLFDLVLPRSIGGGETDVETMVRVIEEVSNHDGATGWAVGIGLGTSVVSAFVDDATAREIFTPRAIIGGPMAPNGRAVPRRWRLSRLGPLALRERQPPLRLAHRRQHRL